MKRVLSILVVLGLLLGMSVVATPALADVTAAVVVVTPDECCGATAEYTITFEITADLHSGTHSITIAFPAGTTVPATYVDGDITVEGVGVFGSEVTVVDTTVTFQVPLDIVAIAGSPIVVVFTTDAGIKNPPAGSYKLNVNTSPAPDATPVESAPYTVRVGPESLEFYQLNYDLDGTVTLNSDWGEVHLTFTGSADILYFNLVINGPWQIQNVAVLCIEGDGVTQTQSFSFDLGNPVGTDVTSLNYVYALTTYTLSLPPAGPIITPAPVSDGWVALYSGFADDPLDPVPPPAVPMIGDEVILMALKGGVENQDCGVNECAPAAVSNSLKYLQKKFDLVMPPYDIQTMKTATNWGTKDTALGKIKGCWYSADPQRAAGERNAWWYDKDAYMKANDYPITTDMFPPKDIDKVFDELSRCQDVEMERTGHTVTVVGMAKLLNGKWLIVFKDDARQGVPGGLRTGKSTFDPTTGRFDDGHLTGHKLNYFVVECPDEPDPRCGPVASLGELAFLEPFIALGAVIMAGAGLVVLRRRRL